MVGRGFSFNCTEANHYKTKFKNKVDYPVALAMRYGSMTIKKGLQELADKGVEDVFLIPVIPTICYGND